MYIGIDIGGTNSRIAGSNDLGSVVFDDVQRFKLSHNFDQDFKEIIEIIRKISNGNVSVIGIGTPGTYNDDGSLLISGGNLSEWVGEPFIKMLSEEFDCPVFADNDAVVASLGEAYYGEGKDKNFIYITWGTGIGGSQVKVENEKISSQKIPWSKYLKEVDAKCAGDGIFKRLKKDASKLSEDEWAEVMNNLELHLENISNIFKEKNIILGGGITVKQKDRVKTVTHNLGLKNISLVASNFGDDVGLYGAMALIKTKFNKK